MCFTHYERCGCGCGSVKYRVVKLTWAALHYHLCTYSRLALLYIHTPIAFFGAITKQSSTVPTPRIFCALVAIHDPPYMYPRLY